ncbi:hypothetical protein AAY473_017279 [Plecturocebus cupreus]
MAIMHLVIIGSFSSKGEVPHPVCTGSLLESFSTNAQAPFSPRTIKSDSLGVGRLADRRQDLALSSRLECRGKLMAHWSLKLLGSCAPLSLPSSWTTSYWAHHYAWLKWGLAITQVGLQPLASSSPRSLASQSAGITGALWTGTADRHCGVDVEYVQKLRASLVQMGTALHAVGWAYCFVPRGFPKLKPPLLDAQRDNVRELGSLCGDLSRGQLDACGHSIRRL